MGSPSEAVSERLTTMDKRRTELDSAVLARLLLKMNDKFNQGKQSVIDLNDYEDSCPSLEAQEMRFDSRYHPFLNKWIDSPAETDADTLLKAQLSHIQLLERIREFTTTDPDYLRLSSAWGLAVTVQPQGAVKLVLNPEFAGGQAEGQHSDKPRGLFQNSGDEVGLNQCMM